MSEQLARITCWRDTGDGTHCQRDEGHDGMCSPEYPITPGRRVKHNKTGDIGVVVGLAKWQSHLPHLLYIVRFEKLGELRQLSVKLTREFFTEVYS